MREFLGMFASPLKLTGFQLRMINKNYTKYDLVNGNSKYVEKTSVMLFRSREYIKTYPFHLFK